MTFWLNARLMGDSHLSKPYRTAPLLPFMKLDNQIVVRSGADLCQRGRAIWLPCGMQHDTANRFKLSLTVLWVRQQSVSILKPACLVLTEHC